MEYNLIENILYCAEYVADISDVLLYSHVPPAAISLILTIFVFSKNTKNVVARILVGIATVF